MTRRLLKLAVQVVYVDDDGDTLTEVVSPTITVPAHKVPDLPSELAAQIAAYNREAAGDVEAG